MLAIANAGRLRFKVDEYSKGDYLARGMGPFRPNERQTLRSYFEVPPDVFVDLDACRGPVRRSGRGWTRRTRCGEAICQFPMA